MKRFGMLLVLLAALAGAGAWNFKRNLEREAKEAGPFASYSDDQLAALRGGYEAEVAGLESRYQARKAQPHQAGDAKFIAEQVKEFERAAARGRAIRSAGGDLAEREAALADIRKEQAKRGGDPTEIFLRRLLSLDGL